MKSGEATLFSGDVKALQLKVEDKKINLNVVNKKFLKDVIDSIMGAESMRHKLAQLKKIAEELKDEGITITVSYKGDIVLTLGSEANPKLPRLITKTNTIEIKNLHKLMQIVI